MAKTARGAIDPSARTSTSSILTPQQLASSGSEHAHQTAIFQWVAITGAKRVPLLSLLFAIPNGGDRRASVAASLKAEGVRAGVPDMCLPVPMLVSNRMYPYPGLWIELKRPGLERHLLGGRSDKQERWHKDLRRQGYAVATAYGWQAATWVLHLYMEGQFEMPNTDDCLFAEAVENPPY